MDRWHDHGGVDDRDEGDRPAEQDEFSRSLLAAAKEYGLSPTTVQRHEVALRRHVPTEDPVLVVALALPVTKPASGDVVLLITENRIVATHETRFLRRIRAYLDADVMSLEKVTWSADPRAAVMELAFRSDGIRHRFLIQLPDRHTVWRTDAVFGRLFLRPLRMAL